MMGALQEWTAACGDAPLLGREEPACVAPGLEGCAPRRSAAFFLEKRDALGTVGFRCCSAPAAD